MKQEPVAWMWENDAWMGVNSFSKEKPSAYPNAVPLYTAPKELSDEEIKTLHDETSWWGVTDPVKFARAILKKASEK
jgi:hypothetical protein